MLYSIKLLFVSPYSVIFSINIGCTVEIIFLAIYNIDSEISKVKSSLRIPLTLSTTKYFK